MTPVRTAVVLDERPNGIALDVGGGRSCRISVLRPDLFRVLFLADGQRPRLDRTWTVPACGAADVPWEGRPRLDESSWPAPDFTTSRTGELVTIETAALRLDVRLAPFGLQWRLPDGRVFAADRTHGWEFAAERRDVAHHMARHPRDRYFGLGDKTGKLDLHGRRLRAMGLDSLGYDPASGDPLYKHWPFLLTQDGETGTAYGAYYDNGAIAAFDLGCAHDNYYGLFRSYEARDGDLDFYLFLGPRLSDVTPAFLALTGRTALPPRWTLGYAQTAMAIADVPDAQLQMEAFIDRCGSERIPVSAFHFGSGYTSIGAKRYVFNWNRAKFPDAPGLMRRFHAAGMQVVANLKPCLLDDHPRYGEIAGLAVRNQQGPVITQFWDGEGAHLDFTNPAAVRWWQDGLEREVLATGIDAGWNDNNEYGLWDETASCDGFGREARLELVRGVQALLMTRATLERQREAAPARRAFTVTRAGCPGIQRYAQTWSGDNTTSWETLRWNLRTGLGMSLSGMLNTGHDIGGFAGPVPEPELLVRWTQTGVLHPRFIMNSWKQGGVYTSPWLHPEATDAIRAAIRLRYRLIPYLYSLVHAAADRGEPIIQPTFLAFQDDPACFEDRDELMLGPFLLGAPVVTQGARERRVYLPDGPQAWFDVHTGAAHAPGSAAVLAAPLDRLPLLACAGAIVPVAADDTGRLHDEPSRHALLFPGPGSGGSRFELQEDDGLTQAGPRTTVTLTLEWSPERVVLRARSEGGYALPYERITASLPAGDARPLHLEGALLAPVIALTRRKDGFDLHLDGRHLVAHRLDRPFLTLGRGEPRVDMYRGNFDIADHVLWRQKQAEASVAEAADGWRIAFAGATLTVSGDAIGFAVADPEVNRVWLRLVAETGEHVWGGGEQMSYFDLRGRRFPLWTSEPGVGRDKSTWITQQADAAGRAGGDYYTTNYPQPTFLSSRRYAAHLDTTAYAAFDFTAPDRHEIEVWAVPEQLEFFAAASFEAASFEALARTLSDRFGRAQPLPDWVLGGAIIGLKDGERSFDRLRRIQDAGVPVAALWCEDWAGVRETSFGTRLFWDWTWNRARYPDLHRHIAELGVRFMGYCNPYLCADGTLFPQAEAAGVLARNAACGTYLVDFGEFECGVIDFTNPEGSAWWERRILRDNMLGIGMSGWMADFGEYLPTDAVLAHGDPMLLHNAWPALWAEVNARATAGTDAVFFMRAGYTGVQAHCPLLWAGDQCVDFSRHDGLQTAICGALSSGLLGNSAHHSDIGGYTSLFGLVRTPELLLRWAEMAAFTPVMRTHEGNRPAENLQIDSDPAILAHFARMTRIHVALAAYVRAVLDEAGLPAQRPLFLHFDDPAAYAIQDAYLYGRDLLVAPVHRPGKQSWATYLPRGARWVHLWSGRRYEGGGAATVPAPLGQPPVFWRDGSRFAALFEAIAGF